MIPDLTMLTTDELAALEEAIEAEYNRRILGDDWREQLARHALPKGTPVDSMVMVWGAGRLAPAEEA